MEMDRRQIVGKLGGKKWRNNGRNPITNGRKKRLGVFGELNLQQNKMKKGQDKEL